MRNNITNQKIQEDTRRSFIKLSTIGVLGSLYSIDMVAAGQESLQIDAAKLKRAYQDVEKFVTKLQTNKREYNKFNKQLSKFLTGLKEGDDLEKLSRALVDSNAELKEIVSTYATEAKMGWIWWLIRIIIMIILLLWSLLAH